MRRILSYVLQLMLLITAIPGASAADLPLLVNADELEAYTAENPVRIVDFRGAAFGDAVRYRLGHIPGAVFLPRESVYDTVEGVDGRLPPPTRVVEDLEKRGIGTDIPVVIYDAHDGLWAARLFWALEYLGHGSVHILDGGLRAWREAGHPISRKPVRLPAAKFELRARSELLATTEWMSDLVDGDNAGYVVIDARSPDEYDGNRSFSKRKGHIPGAMNIEWIENLRNGEGSAFDDVDSILTRYGNDGIDGSIPIVTYCQTGVRAAHSYFTLRLLGFPNVRMYDDSWEVWGNRPDTIIE